MHSEAIIFATFDCTETSPYMLPWNSIECNNDVEEIAVNWYVAGPTRAAMKQNTWDLELWPSSRGGTK